MDTEMTSWEPLQRRRDDAGIVWLTLDVPDGKVNTLSQRVFAAFEQALAEVAADEVATGLVILSGKPSGFIAGADIGELATMTADEAYLASRRAQAILDRLENLAIPTVAAVHGPCLGGGLELALACQARLVSDDAATQMGLPEVQLGLIPGAGGTQRLPRLIGLSAALDMILTGKSVRSGKLVKLGLAAAAVPPALLRQQAADLIERLRDGNEPTASKTLRERIVDSAVARPQVIAAARKKLLEKGSHLPAPFKALTAVEQGLALGMADGLAIEAKLFSELVGTAVNRALVHVFQATTAAKAAASRAEGTTVTRLGVVGGGLMGAGIATVAAAAGIPTRLRDADSAAIGRALQAVDAHFTAQVEAGRLPVHERSQKIGLVSGTLDGTGFPGCDVVIEAVFEDLALKRRILADWESVARPEAVFATNTSSLSIAAIAAESRQPERVVGMHFFSPVPKMPLVEVIVHPGTAAAATGTVVALARRLGKHVIVVRDGVGFYTSRVIGAYLNEAMHLLADGARVEAIDAAMTAFGFPVGPCTLMDEVGLDVGQKVTHILHEAFGERLEPPAGFDLLVTPLRRGRKSDRGFYVYDEPGRPVDETVYGCFHDRPATAPSEAAIQQRLVLTFCNEAAWALSEGVLASPDDGDLGAIYGLGFPAFLGGPFWYLDQVGLPRVVAALDDLATTVGPRFAPAPVLRERVAAGRPLCGG